MKKKLQKELVGNPYYRIQEITSYSWQWLHEDVAYQVSAAIEEKVELYLRTSRSPIWRKEINDGKST